jgi:hypothetical protein
MMYKDIEKILENFRLIEVQAIDIYSKTVQDIIVSKSEDKKLIEHIFDGMLGFCYDEDMLKLFKKLCRYYYDIDPQATADYINIYREMWDNEDEEKYRKRQAHNEPKKNLIMQVCLAQLCVIKAEKVQKKIKLRIKIVFDFFIAICYIVYCV